VQGPPPGGEKGGKGGGKGGHGGKVRGKPGFAMGRCKALKKREKPGMIHV
jgi:hypothetical protein